MEQLIEIIVNNFWQLLIIIALLSHRSCWKYGIFLLFTELFWGFKWYLYTIVFIFAFIFDVFDLNQKMKSQYERKIKDLEDKLRDPDYR